ncbi:2-succinyl-5-enolpyruvyl-6-hydroxy-3-cyclohexene-1-carboxylic-acid synthase [Leptobacterium sp. I13]|uniref:2-succinyl-5-enolpyruvyl-6-hydroxy-3- cyclohexene-1-carboxylic-acid synthase n=1 Tax=Leptobacterium meishanense TaxID=3128904 RepID=UPI0030EF7CA1
MKYPKILLAQTVVELCKLKGIEHIVISPGSRNAPLIIGFTEAPFFKTYSIVDERCAGFFGLGIAQQTRKPIALVCTSGSALLNYYPAIAEAFYSDIPMVIITADRPINKIDIGDGQTIRQPDVFSNHILYSGNLKESIDAQIHNEKIINEALNKAKVEKGPVHINVPFEEPLYEIVENSKIAPKIIEPDSLDNEVLKEDTTHFVKAWNASNKKMVLVGSSYPGSIAKSTIDFLVNDTSVNVFTETTSNTHGENFFPGIDKIIAPIEKNTEEIAELQPDILITFGGMIVSKKIKAFLRSYQPQYHFHIDKKKAYDTYFCLTTHFKTTPDKFFQEIIPDLKKVKSDYHNKWTAIKKKREKKHCEYLDKIPFTDLKAYDIVFKTIPENYCLQLSNSSTIRYSQLFNLDTTIKVFCNRGTSGIEGSTSTAVGAAVENNTPTILITGDLSFFYDSNGLWNQYIPKSFRIIVFNNSGGGIFRILPGTKNTNNFDTYFETKHALSAKQLCDMYKIQYMTAKNEESLQKQLKAFYKKADQPKLLEIFTPRTVNDKVLLNYFQYLK